MESTNSRLEEVWDAEDRCRNERDSANAEAKALAEEIRKLKALRDEANKKVAEFKRQRDAKHEETKNAITELKKFQLQQGVDEVPRRGGGRGGGRRTSSARLKALLDRMEFDYQTKPMPFHEEKKFVKEIEALRKSMKAASVAEMKFGALSALEKAMMRTRRESDELHMQVVIQAKASQDAHEKIIKKQAEIDRLRAAADGKHEKFLELKTTALVLHGKVTEERRGRSEVFQKRRVEERQRARSEIDKVAAEIEKKVEEESKDKKKKRKKFDMRDLQLLSETGKKIPF